ncbi:unnamed protein product [Medioppia subpectinata]|uniref:XK-related protein n=1 Tax=Medioppia subpectinata TaxID=1979941 RepID=A0A7R9QBA2_9ACAR|nr:unnamed protein product [Medioppia subpectinata]CAG2117740.1 unnamed protein product [Medioppia subpectinata]
MHRSFEYREQHFKCYLYKKRELSRAGIIETFMESAPQLVLQLYIVEMRSTQNIGVLSGVGVLASLLGLSISVVTYERMRVWYFNGSKWSLPEHGANYLWRLFEINARVLAISLFASVFPIHLAVVGCVHYLAMFVWIGDVMSDTDRKNKTSSAPPLATTPDWPPINWPEIPEPIGESQSNQFTRTRFYKELRNSAGVYILYGSIPIVIIQRIPSLTLLQMMDQLYRHNCLMK